MKALILLILGSTLLGLTYLITISEGRFILDLGKNGAKVQIDSRSHSSLDVKGDDCQPGEESNRLCDTK